MIGSAVIAAQIRHWLAIVGIGAAVTIVLTIGATAVRLALTAVTLPYVVVAGALGALVTLGGVIALARR